MKRTLILAATLLPLFACKGLDTGAKETFAKQFSCPEGRVDVHPRPDIDVYAATFGGQEPAADVRKDPARYEMWKKQQAEAHESWNSRFTAFEVKGCGHEVFYGCSHPNSGRHGEINYADSSCSELSHPPGKKR